MKEHNVQNGGPISASTPKVSCAGSDFTARPVKHRVSALKHFDE